MITDQIIDRLKHKVHLQGFAARPGEELLCECVDDGGHIAFLAVPIQKIDTGEIANVKLSEGKMHTPGQCKTISNGLLGFGAQKYLDRVVSGDFRINKAENPESQKLRIT